MYTRFQDFNSAGFQFWKMVQAICLMLKNIITQSFTWICAHFIWTMASGRWKLFFMRTWPVSLYFVRHRFFHPPQPANISHSVQISADMGCMRQRHFSTAFLLNTVARYSISKQTLFFFILQNCIDFTFLVPVESASISFSFQSLCLNDNKLGVWSF